MKDMRAAIVAFDLKTKELGLSNLPCDSEYINGALKLMGKTMSDETIRHWLKKVRSNLECENKERNQFEDMVQSLLKKFKLEH